MAAFGGIIGALIASYLTEQPNPRYCFLINAVVGLSITVYGCCLSPEVEGTGQAASSDGIWADVKRNCGEIKEAIMIPEFHRVLIYLLLNGLLIPSFGSFGYYFMIDVV